MILRLKGRWKEREEEGKEGTNHRYLSRQVRMSDLRNFRGLNITRILINMKKNCFLPGWGGNSRQRSKEFQARRKYSGSNSPPRLDQNAVILPINQIYGNEKILSFDFNDRIRVVPVIDNLL